MLRTLDVFTHQLRQEHDGGGGKQPGADGMRHPQRNLPPQRQHAGQRCRCEGPAQALRCHEGWSAPEWLPEPPPLALLRASHQALTPGRLQQHIGDHNEYYVTVCQSPILRLHSIARHDYTILSCKPVTCSLSFRQHKRTPHAEGVCTACMWLQRGVHLVPHCTRKAVGGAGPHQQAQRRQDAVRCPAQALQTVCGALDLTACMRFICCWYCEIPLRRARLQREHMQSAQMHVTMVGPAVPCCHATQAMYCATGHCGGDECALGVMVVKVRSDEQKRATHGGPAHAHACHHPACHTFARQLRTQ